MTIKPGLRPCFVRGMGGEFTERALFHCWGFKAWTHGEGLMIGSFPAGQEAYVFAIVEREGGEVTTEDPRNVKFADNMVAGFCWGERKEGAHVG